MNIERQNRRILDSAATIAVQIEELKQNDPVAASIATQQVLQYLRERLPIETTFTLGQLEELGYIS